MSALAYSGLQVVSTCSYVLLTRTRRVFSGSRAYRKRNPDLAQSAKCSSDFTKTAHFVEILGQ